VEVAIVGRAIAEEADHHFLLLAILDRVRDADRQRDVPRDDRVAAPEFFRHVGEVHRAAAPAADARGATVKFGHRRAGFATARQGVAVVAVVGDDVVFLAESPDRADRDGLFADVEVAETADLAVSVGFGALLLETADEDHLTVQVDQSLVAEVNTRPFAPLVRGRAVRCRPSRPRPWRFGVFRYRHSVLLAWDAPRAATPPLLSAVV
jgi:hypothetical protein